MMVYKKLDFFWFTKDLTIDDGKMTIPNHVNIAGILKMDIESEGKVVVAETGKVIGSITASDVKIHGEVTGDIKASGNLVIYKNGAVKGSITAKNLVIEEGAKCNFMVTVGSQLKPGKLKKRTARISKPASLEVAAGM